MMVGTRLFDLFRRGPPSGAGPVRPAAARSAARSTPSWSGYVRERDAVRRAGAPGRRGPGAGARRPASTSSTGWTATACCRRSRSSSAGPAATPPCRSACRRAAADHAGRGGRDPRGRRGRTGRAAPDDLDVLGYWEWRRGAAARGRRAPRRAAPGVQGGRRGAVRPRPGQGGLRHRDAGAGHQHAGPHRGARAAGQVQRRDARRADAGGVHPADRAGRPARHRRRGPRGRALAARGRPASRSPGWPRPAPTRCARSFRPVVQHGRQPRRPARSRRQARELLEQSFAQFQADRAVVGLARQVRPQRGGARRVRRVDALPPRRLRRVRRAARQRLTEREKALAREGDGRSARAAAEQSLERLRPRRRDRVPSGRRVRAGRRASTPACTRPRDDPPAGGDRGPVGRPAVAGGLPDPGRAAGPDAAAQALQPPLPAGPPRPGLVAAQRPARRTRRAGQRGRSPAADDDGARPAAPGAARSTPATAAPTGRSTPAGPSGTPGCERETDRPAQPGRRTAPTRSPARSTGSARC